MKDQYLLILDSQLEVNVFELTPQRLLQQGLFNLQYHTTFILTCVGLCHSFLVTMYIYHLKGLAQAKII